MRFRSFRNTDPPLIAALWSQQPQQRGLANVLTPQMLDQYVLSKPYFDPEGLIVAEKDGGMIGFAHAGFGPNEQRTDISTELGVTCMVMVANDADQKQVAGALLAESEAYLKKRGGRVLYGGCMAPLNPFYLGLYGGSELPGILRSDKTRLNLFKSHGYVEIDRCIILQRQLTGFRIPIDRRQMQLRRSYRVEMDSFPSQLDWWDACSGPPCEPTRFELIPTNGGPACGSVHFWIIEPMSSTWGALSVGLTKLEIDKQLQQQGLATYLSGEALRQLQINGVGVVEVQTMQNNIAALGLYRKLGFQEVDQGIVFRKQ